VNFAHKDTYAIYRGENLITKLVASRAIKRRNTLVFEFPADIEVGDKLINEDTQDEYYVKDMETSLPNIIDRERKKLVVFETKAQHSKHK
jgi:hypothetical protein